VEKASFTFGLTLIKAYNKSLKHRALRALDSF
jgi:hypothetical protein